MLLRELHMQSRYGAKRLRENTENCIVYLYKMPLAALHLLLQFLAFNLNFPTYREIQQQ